MADKELTALIDDIVQRKFVSLEAADAISAIKKRAEELEKQNADLIKANAASRKLVEDLERANAALVGAEASVRVREDAVLKREAAALKSELDAAHSKDKAELTERLFNTVFRNQVLTRTMMGNTAVPNSTPGYGPTTLPVSRTDTETVA